MRTLPVAAFAALLLLAGCSTPASTMAPADSAHAGAPDASSAARLTASAPTFLPPVDLGTVLAGAEPSVAIAPDGTAYVETPLALWRSDDGGKSFQQMGAKGCTAPGPTCPPGLETYDPGLVGGGDGSLAVTADGTVQWAGLGTGIPYQRSTDRGASWSRDVDVSDGTGSDREWVTADRDSGLLAVQWRGSDAKGSGIFVNTSMDNGLTWGKVARVADDGRQGPIAHDPTSPAMVLAHQTTNLLLVARSLDGGAHWTDGPDLPVNGRPYIFPVTAFDANGTAYLVFAADPDALSAVDVQVEASRVVAKPHVYLQVSHDKGASWTPPRMLSPPDVPAFFPWIDAGAAGRVVVAWYQAQEPVPANRLPNVFDVKVALSGNADQKDATFAVGQANTSPVHVGAFCTEGAACTLTGGDRSMLDFFEVRVHPDGGAVLAWTADDAVKQARVHVFAAKMSGGLDLLH